MAEWQAGVGWRGECRRRTYRGHQCSPRALVAREEGARLYDLRQATRGASKARHRAGQELRAADWWWRPAEQAAARRQWPAAQTTARASHAERSPASASAWGASAGGVATGRAARHPAAASDAARLGATAATTAAARQGRRRRHEGRQGRWWRTRWRRRWSWSSVISIFLFVRYSAECRLYAHVARYMITHE